MTESVDMTQTIAPKSDQMNYDDFITGTKTITVTGVKITGQKGDAQPVSVNYQGDDGKPYKPCLSMRRVMVKVWGGDALEYVGKSMTLFGDPNVIFAGQKVGGIRISHMSHIDKEVIVALSASKTKRIGFKVLPLRVEIQETIADDDTLEDARTAAKLGTDTFTAWWQAADKPARAQAKAIMPELKAACTKADNDNKGVNDDDPFGIDGDGPKLDEDPPLDVPALLIEISNCKDNELLAMLQTGNTAAVSQLGSDDQSQIADAFKAQFDNNSEAA